jgi:glycosidase
MNMRVTARASAPILILVTALLAGSAGAQDRVPPAWAKNAVLYEVNVRQYTPQGTFSALRTHLPRLRALGVDALWLMPVQRIGKLNRKGLLGSYYSIADYRSINPEFGTASDFRAFVADAHQRGMRIILDWVPNHTAFDHAWATEHPEWYVHRADGSISNAIDESGKETDWTDVAQLNYDNPQLRAAMIGEMRWWLTDMKVDGFRCDFAAGVPLDFWVDARRQLAGTKPDIFMLAEAESPGLGAAFDMSYGWELHHLLNDVSQGKKPTSELEAYVQRQRRAYRDKDFHMYFTSNHDENSWTGTEFERMGANHLPSFVLAATMRGSFPEIYTGQEVSLNKRLRFFEKDTVDWSGPSLTSFYQSMFELRHAESALWSGTWGAPQRTLSTDGGTRVYAFTRMRGSDGVLIAVNFGDAPASVGYQGLAQTGAFTDWFSHSPVSLATSGKLDIPAHGYRVLVHGAPASRSGQ